MGERFFSKASPLFGDVVPITILAAMAFVIKRVRARATSLIKSNP
jgi:hypothetical protein